MFCSRNYVYIGSEKNSSTLRFGKCIAFGFLTSIAWFGAIWHLSLLSNQQPKFVTMLYASFVQLLTYKLHYDDKMASNFGKGPRIPEDLMHFCTLLGGGPATVFAMLSLDQKTRHPHYQAEFMKMCLASWLIICVVAFYNDLCIVGVCKLGQYMLRKLSNCVMML